MYSFRCRHCLSLLRLESLLPLCAGLNIYPAAGRVLSMSSQSWEEMLSNEISFLPRAGIQLLSWNLSLTCSELAKLTTITDAQTNEKWLKEEKKQIRWQSYWQGLFQARERIRPTFPMKELWTVHDSTVANYFAANELDVIFNWQTWCLEPRRVCKS